MPSRHQRRNWLADPLTPDLLARGLTKGDSFDNIYDYEAGLGGKIFRDKLWWFSAARKNAVDTLVADTFNPDGSLGVNAQYMKNASSRLTAQVSRAPSNQPCTTAASGSTSARP